MPLTRPANLAFQLAGNASTAATNIACTSRSGAIHHHDVRKPTADASTVERHLFTEHAEHRGADRCYQFQVRREPFRRERPWAPRVINQRIPNRQDCAESEHVTNGYTFRPQGVGRNRGLCCVRLRRILSWSARAIEAAGPGEG